MAEGCKAFEAENPFVMLTRVLQRALILPLLLYYGRQTAATFRPGADTGAAVGIVGSGANLLQYLQPRV